MSDELKDLDKMDGMGVTPTLTFEPFKEEEKKSPVMDLKKQKEEVPALDESALSPEERRMVNDFAQQIDLGNSSMILQYGAGAQKKMADFSEAALNNVKTKDLGEIGDILSSVVVELKRDRKSVV